MEIRIKVNTIVIRDAESGQEASVRTVRSVEEIRGYIDETEAEALEDIMYRLKAEYH